MSRSLNQRRIQLIQKNLSEGLSAEETAELQRLQLLADQQLEAADNQRLEDLRRLQECLRSESLGNLIGICQTDNPPSDEEVKGIIDDEGMKRFG